MIKNSSIQEVMETAKVEEVVADFVNLKRRGVNLAGLCPFHSEKTPSFYVSPAKNIYKCFGCGKGGDPVRFIMDHESLSFPEAIRYLAKRYGIELEETQQTDEEREARQHEDSLYLVNEFARQFYEDQLFRSDLGQSIGLAYFKDRGFTQETIKTFGLGYASPQGDAFQKAAEAAGYNRDLLKELGLISQYDRDFFRDRVMFTIQNLSGKVIAFAGRIMGKDKKAPKYVNSPESAIYKKSKVLYGMFQARTAIRKEDECLLVEGYTDVLSLHQAGIQNVVASSGTSLTEGQIRLIKRYTENVKILYDGDAAGIQAALRGLDMLLSQGLNVRIVLLPDGEDPDSSLQAMGPKVFQEFIDHKAQDFIFFKTNLLAEGAKGDPVQKTQVIKDIVQSIALIPDPIKRALYIRECAGMVKVEEQLLVNEINKIVGTVLRKRRQKEEARTLEKQLKEDQTSSQGPEKVNQPGEAASGEQFQERDLVRLLIQHGHKPFDEAANISVAQYLIGNTEDLFEEFDQRLYRKIYEEYKTALKNHALDSHYFTQHTDPEIQKLAVDLLSIPYNYSENWAEKWGVFLEQKHPDENHRKDAENSLKHFRLRKINRMIERNKAKVEELFHSGSEDYLMYLQLNMKLESIRNELAKELGIVVIR